jgi:large subunit ribosomal protein L32
MAVPKSKISKAKRNSRRAHDSLKTVNWVEDQHTGEPKRRHHIDLKTGMYKGRQVLTEAE